MYVKKKTPRKKKSPREQSKRLIPQAIDNQYITFYRIVLFYICPPYS